MQWIVLGLILVAMIAIAAFVVSLVSVTVGKPQAGKRGHPGNDGLIGVTGPTGDGGGGDSDDWPPFPLHIYSVPGSYQYYPCDGTNSVQVTVIGAGGAGGVAAGVDGSGGGAGATIQSIVAFDNVDNPYLEIQVGAGSISGVSTSSASFVTGGTVQLIAGGGQDGNAVSGSPQPFIGGTGGVPLISNPTSLPEMSFGVDGQDGAPSVGSSIVGGSQGGSAYLGGAGGWGGTSNLAPTDGYAGAGGGGATNPQTTAGNGGDGLVIIKPLNSIPWSY
jgi:hypothetical protein